MIKAGMRIAAVATALSTWGLSTALSTAAAAPTITNHPRISAAKPHSTTGWSSSNWSGYAKTGGPFTSATGRWVVPSVSQTSKASYSSSWVGIDGFNNSSLIQTGTEQDWYSGSAHYAAWWEILPAAETVIPSITPSPGDVMTASITQVSAGQFTITLTDTTRNQSFTTQQAYGGQLTSVEWIQEAPSLGGRVATLAHYSSPTLFDPGTANGHSPGLTAADGGVMVQSRTQVSTPSAPDGDTDGFNVSYGSAAPSPPGS
ncbi:MAG TPA: G1 family glutamic endopeptidase [Candidatus Angelobacter sp.]|jgi:hypothetical protein|nr:G1 family glutamic endopeptidase [Candidatus Angelobacter sp.]